MTSTIGKYKLTIPDSQIPIFNPAIFKVEGVATTATMIIYEGDVVYTDIRQPIGGVVEWEISPYLHAFFPDFQTTRQRQKYITVKINVDESITNILQETYLCLYAYSTPHAPIGKPLRQVYYRGLRWMNQVFTLLCGDEDPIETAGGGRYNDSFSEPWQGYKDFSYVDIYQSEDAGWVNVKTWHEDGVIYNFRTDDSTCGVMLKWLNAQGFYCYYLMQEGELTTTTKDAGENLPMYYEHKKLVGFFTDEITGQTTIPQGVTTSQSLKLCATFTDKEDRELLDTIFNAPLVWIVDKDNGNETPVTIKRGSTTTAKGLQDYEIEVNIPSPPKMML